MHRLVPILRTAAEAVAVVAFAAFFFLFLLQVFMRYVMGVPLDWTQEAGVLLYIWGVFWTSAFLTRVQDHVAFSLIYDAAKPRVRRVLLAVGSLAIAAAFAIDLPYAIDYVQFMSITSTPVMGLRFDYVYSIFPLFMAATAVAALVTAVRLCGRNWRNLTRDEAAGPAVDAPLREFE